MPNNMRKVVYAKLITATAMVAPAPAAPTPIGPIIPDDMVRRITRITIANVAAPQTLELAQGNAVAPLARIIQDFMTSPLLPSVFGTPEPTMPLFVARPITSVAPAATQQNRIYAIGLLAAVAVTVTIEYWDQRG